MGNNTAIRCVRIGNEKIVSKIMDWFRWVLICFRSVIMGYNLAYAKVWFGVAAHPDVPHGQMYERINKLCCSDY